MTGTSGAGRAHRLVLASASPRRRGLLELLGVPFEVRAADIDEQALPGEDPKAYVVRLARSKAQVVASQLPPDTVVIGADTTVSVDGGILGKPVDRSDAARMLQLLSGRTHWVHTGVSLVTSAEPPRADVVTTEVDFAPLTPAEIAWYLDTGEPFDKAGGYALQGAGGAFVRAIRGSASNVVGLPLRELVELARRTGLGLWPAPDLTRTGPTGSADDRGCGLG